MLGFCLELEGTRQKCTTAHEYKSRDRDSGKWNEVVERW